MVGYFVATGQDMDAEYLQAFCTQLFAGFINVVYGSIFISQAEQVILLVFCTPSVIWFSKDDFL